MNDFAGTTYGQDTEPHPLREQLLLYVDGELTEKEAGLVRAHLEACWKCRARSAALEETIAEFSRFDEATLTPHLPAPPNNWRGFNPHLRRLAAENGSPKLLSRLRGLLTMNFTALPLAAPLTAIVVTALLLLAAGVWLSRSQIWLPQVSAQELLQRATQSETAMLERVAEPVVYRKLQVRRSGASEAVAAPVIWESWKDAQRNQFRQRVADQQGLRFMRDNETPPPLIAELTTVLQANHFDRQRPLSAAAFAEWRKTIKTKAESVVASRDELKLTTIAREPHAENAIIEAALVVHKSDWHAVALKLKVQGVGEIREYELSETAYEVLPLQALNVFAEFAPLPVPSALPATAPTALPTRAAAIAVPSPAIPLPTEAELPSEAALKDAEVAALYALHQLQADLGEQLEVVRAADRQIIVRGLVEQAARKEQLTQALKHLPLVTARIQTVEEAVRQTQQNSPPAAATISTNEISVNAGSAAASVNPFQQKMAEHFGGRAGLSEAERQEINRQVAQLANAIETDASAAMAEAWALRRLAERFGQPTDANASAASPAARQRIDEMIGNHAARLKLRTRNLRARLEPLLVTLAGAAPAVSFNPAASSQAQIGWQAQIGTIFKTVEQVSRLTDQLLDGNEQSAAATRQAARQLLTELARLEQALPLAEQQRAR
ncbi:MAG: zf-HC2 domain-containing protein [Acidobacteria bacterium]|nr:zf-HC2 domain-containing protein [Acidobacteriota bacterium]MBI3428386.1 zf-HC2 domain-containing protein [Acidobacteriota bacterium]